MKEKIEKLFNSKVLCMFYGGSHAYKTNNENSDEDIMVIIEGDRKLVHIPFVNIDGKNVEYLVMGHNYFRKVQSIDPDVNDFIVAHADNVLNINSNIIFLDESYKEDLTNISKEKWNEKLPLFLNRFVLYMRKFINNKNNIKRYYHIYRLRSMLDHFEDTGKFEIEYKEPYYSKMIEYKNHYKNLENKNIEVVEMLNYIENLARRITKYE